MSIDKTFINLDSLIDSAVLEKVIKDIENNIKHLETTAEKLLEILNTKDVKNTLKTTAQFGILALNASAIAKIIKLLENSYKNIEISNLDHVILVLEKMLEVFDAFEEVKNKIKSTSKDNGNFYKDNIFDSLMNIFLVAKDTLEMLAIEKIIEILKNSFKSLDLSELDDLMDALRKIIEVFEAIEEVKNKIKSMSMDNGNFFKDNIFDSLKDIFIVLKDALEIGIVEVILRLLRKYLETANMAEYDTLIASLEKLIEVLDAIEAVRNKIKSMSIDSNSFFKDNAFDSLKNLFIVLKDSIEVILIDMILRALRSYMKKMDMVKYDNLIAALKKLTEVLKAIEEVKNTVKGMTTSNGVFNLSKILGFVPASLELTVDIGSIIFLQEIIELMAGVFSKIDSKKMDQLIVDLNKMKEVLVTIREVKEFIEDMTESNGVFNLSKILGFIPASLELTVEIGALTFIQKLIDWMSGQFRKIKSQNMNRLITDLNRLKKVLKSIREVKEYIEDMTQSNGIFKASTIFGFVPDSIEAGVDILGLIAIQKLVDLMSEQFQNNKLTNLESVTAELEKLKTLLSSIMTIKNYIESMTDSDGMFKGTKTFGFAAETAETTVDIIGITAIQGMLKLMEGAFKKISFNDVELFTGKLNKLLEVVSKIKEIKDTITSLTNTDNFFSKDGILKTLATFLGFGSEAKEEVNFLKTMQKNINAINSESMDKLLNTLSKMLEIIEKIKLLKGNLQIPESGSSLLDSGNINELNNGILDTSQIIKNNITNDNLFKNPDEQTKPQNNITLNIGNIANKYDFDYIIEKLTTLHLS